MIFDLAYSFCDLNRKVDDISEKKIHFSQMLMTAGVEDALAAAAQHLWDMFAFDDWPTRARAIIRSYSAFDVQHILPRPPLAIDTLTHTPLACLMWMWSIDKTNLGNIYDSIYEIPSSFPSCDVVFLSVELCSGWNLFGHVLAHTLALTPLSSSYIRCAFIKPV